MLNSTKNIMNHSTIRNTLFLAFAAMTFTGCHYIRFGSEDEETAPRPTAEEASEESSEQRKISEIMDLRDAGEITNEEASRRINQILGVEPTSSAQTAESVLAQAESNPESKSEPGSMPAMETSPVDPLAAQLASLREYKPQVVLNQRLRSKGSDTMDRLMEQWEKAFQQYHSRIRVIHEGRGSSSAMPALVEGSSDFGPMSRPVKAKEEEEFVRKYGYPPTSIPVGIDALAVYVNPANPIARKGLSIKQLDAIFGSELKRGNAKIAETWGDLGLTGEYAKQPIRIYSRNSASGTYSFFRSQVLDGGSYKETNTELPSSEAVVKAVANDPYGIGYSGIGYKTPEVRTVPVAEFGTAFVEASGENALNGTYPLARFLYLTINHNTSEGVNHLHREFLRFVFSPEGQRIVLESGYFPVNRVISDQALDALGY